MENLTVERSITDYNRAKQSKNNSMNKAKQRQMYRRNVNINKEATNWKRGQQFQKEQKYATSSKVKTKYCRIVENIRNSRKHMQTQSQIDVHATNGINRYSNRIKTEQKGSQRRKTM